MLDGEHALRAVDDMLTHEVAVASSSFSERASAAFRSPSATPSTSASPPGHYRNSVFSSKGRGEGASASPPAHYGNNSAFSFKGRGEGASASPPAHYGNNSAFSFKGRGEDRGGNDGGNFNNPAFSGMRKNQNSMVSRAPPPTTSHVPISSGVAPALAHASLMEEARALRAARGEVEFTSVHVSAPVNPNARKLKELHRSLRALLDMVSQPSCAESLRERILHDLDCKLVFPDADRQRVIANEVKRKISTLETAPVEVLDAFGATLERLSAVDLSGRAPAPSASASACEIMPDASNTLTLASVSISADIRNHYKTLELTPDASIKDIKAAYRRLSPQYHPDTAAEYDEKKWHDLLDAYTTLSDPASRAVYDQDGDTAVEAAAAAPSAAEASANYLAKVRGLRQRVKDLSADLRSVKRDVRHAKAAQVSSAAALVTAQAARDVALSAYSDSVRAKDFKVKQNAIKGVKLSWAFFSTSTTPLLKALAEAQVLVNTRDAEDNTCRDLLTAAEQKVLECTQTLAALEKELTSTVDAWARPPPTSAKPRRLALGGSSQQVIEDDDDEKTMALRKGKYNKRGGGGGGGGGAGGGGGDDY
jgi:curved DNA-binding protein CbpA